MTGTVLQNPNDIQIGGSHYSSGGKFQHWDFVIGYLHNRYLEGQISKYLYRYRDKNGKQDILKALHYCSKLISSYRSGLVFPMSSARTFKDPPIAQIGEKFSHLSPNVISIFEMLSMWGCSADLGVLLGRIESELATYTSEEPGVNYVDQDSQS